MRDERGLVGVIFLLAMIAFAALYLLVAGSMFESFENSTLTSNSSVNTSFIDGTAAWDTIKVVGLQGVPLVILSTGVVFALAWYLRRERFGGGGRPPF